VRESGTSHPRSATSRLRATGVHVCLALVLASSLLGSQDSAQSYAARIESAQAGSARELGALTIAELLQRTRVPGVSLAVINDRTIHFARGYGLAEAGSNRPVRVDTPFQAASISKSVTAMATVRLAQEGRFSLDADINTLLKSWKVPASGHPGRDPVTPRGLSSHTAGADDGFGFPAGTSRTADPTGASAAR
jgi:CubicO group peptidase (beta-lactamase class C family)